MSEKTEVKVKTVKKTADILNCFLEKQPLGVSEISEKLGQAKSNVHRILHSLTSVGYLEQDKESGKYYLGIGILKLSRAVGDRYNFHNVAKKHMQKLADEVKETIYLTVPMNREVYYLDTIMPTGGRHFVASMVAATNHMHCTSCGKAMMAHMPDGFLEGYFLEPVEPSTEHTITDLERMREELKIIRERGYATDNMEATLGMSCVGVPILSGTQNVVGALSMSGPSQQFTEDYIKILTVALKICVRKIEDSL